MDDRYPSSRSASTVADELAAVLDGDDDSDFSPAFGVGSRHVTMIGAHNDRGLCWCQPRVESALHVGSRDGPHEDHIFVHRDVRH